MEWKAYGACCRMRALDGEAKVCPDCGHPLLRCRSFADCRALLGPLEACPIHVAPGLELKSGAVLSPSLGDRVALPLVFRNGTGAGGDLRVRKIFRLVPGRDPEEPSLPWETVLPGEERSFSIETGTLDAVGTCMVNLVLELTASLGGIDEDFAFEAGIPLRIRREETKQIIQNIRVEGGSFAAGASAVVQTGPSIHEGFRAPEGGESSAGSRLSLERAEAFELRRGIRGYREEGFRVPRTVEVACLGFPGDDAPPPSRPFIHAERFACGRNSRRPHPENPKPNDLSIRVYAGEGGPADPERSMRIAGRHLELFLQDDRLCLRCLGRNGTWLNGRALPAGTETPLRPLDRIAVLDPRSAGTELTVSMVSRGALAERIVLERRG